jgi:nitrate reductase gamma subunit
VEFWVEFARGPLFRAALAFMVLGLLRHLFVAVWESASVYRRAGDKSIPGRNVLRATLAWVFPVKKVGNRLVFGITTMAFHLSVIVVAVFLPGHVALWESGVGVSWPAIPNSVADVLTVIAIVTAFLLLVERSAARDSRTLSTAQDYVIPLLVALPFVTGFLVMHPGLNPMPFAPTMLLHALSADLLLFLIPVTKLSHIVLQPATQMVSELAWHFPPDSGRKVALALGREEDRI